MNNISLKFKIGVTAVLLLLSLVMVYFAFVKGEDSESAVMASEVSFEGIDQKYKVLIYQNGDLKFSGNGNEKMDIPPGEYQLIVVDSANEDKKESQDVQIPSAEKVNINLEEVKKKIEASPTPKPTAVPGEVVFVDPLSKCEGYTYARGFTDWHKGVDLTKSKGCVIVAAADGDIEYAGWGSEGQGFYVVIKHSNGFSTQYNHGNGEFYVKKGDKVKAGTDIMFMGSTGNSTGLHLHFELAKNGKNVNPENYIEFKK